MAIWMMKERCKKRRVACDNGERKTMAQDDGGGDSDGKGKVENTMTNVDNEERVGTMKY